MRYNQAQIDAIVELLSKNIKKYLEKIEYPDKNEKYIDIYELFSYILEIVGSYQRNITISIKFQRDKIYEPRIIEEHPHIKGKYISFQKRIFDLA